MFLPSYFVDVTISVCFCLVDEDACSVTSTAGDSDVSPVSTGRGLSPAAPPPALTLLHASKCHRKLLSSKTHFIDFNENAPG